MASRKEYQQGQQIVNRIAPKAGEELRQLFLKVGKRESYRGVETALANGDAQRAAQIAEDAFAAELPATRAAVAKHSRDALESTAANAVNFIPAEAAAGLVFDVTNPRALEVATSQSSRFIERLAGERAEAVRVVIARSFEEGIDARATARALRETVGLSGRNVDAVANYRRFLQDVARRPEGALPKGVLKRLGRSNAFGSAAVRRSEQLSQTIINARVKEYSARLLRERALVLSRTEIQFASNQGQQLLWDQAVMEGRVSQEQKRQWIVSRPCPICAPMEGQIRGMNEPFVSPFNGASTDTPPIHPACKCGMGLLVE